MKNLSVVNVLLLMMCMLSLHVKLYHAYINDMIGVSVHLRKNQTGHMVSEWSVKKGSPKIPQNMKINISTGITESGGIQLFQIKGLISAPPPKPADYELFPGVGYYKFYAEGAPSFHEASSICSRNGGHLAIANSENEIKVLVTLYNRYPRAHEWAWMGFHDMDVEGKFVTIFGDPIAKTGFNRWHRGQPDSAGGNEDCGSIHKSGGLNDLSCEGHWPFFCEYDLAWAES